MSEFIDCDMIICEGGACNGIVYPVAHNIDRIEFNTSGELIAYRRTAPLEFTGEHIVFKLVEDE